MKQTWLLRASTISLTCIRDPRMVASGRTEHGVRDGVFAGRIVHLTDLVGQQRHGSLLQNFWGRPRGDQGPPAGDAAVGATSILTVRQAGHTYASVDGNSFVQLQQGEVIVMGHVVLV